MYPERFYPGIFFREGKTGVSGGEEKKKRQGKQKGYKRKSQGRVLYQLFFFLVYEKEERGSEDWQKKGYGKEMVLYHKAAASI